MPTNLSPSAPNVLTSAAPGLDVGRDPHEDISLKMARLSRQRSRTRNRWTREERCQFDGWWQGRHGRSYAQIPLDTPADLTAWRQGYDAGHAAWIAEFEPWRVA